MVTSQSILDSLIKSIQEIWIRLQDLVSSFTPCLLHHNCQTRASLSSVSSLASVYQVSYLDPSLDFIDKTQAALPMALMYLEQESLAKSVYSQ